jgi:hypothetical protein
VGIARDQVKDDAVYAYIPLEVIRARYGNVAGQFAKAKVADETAIESVRLQIEQTAFVTESIVDTIADINSFFSIVRAILIVFGIIHFGDGYAQYAERFPSSAYEGSRYPEGAWGEASGHFQDVHF